VENCGGIGPRRPNDRRCGRELEIGTELLRKSGGKTRTTAMSGDDRLISKDAED
jgi:hypothetical protein